MLRAGRHLSRSVALFNAGGIHSFTMSMEISAPSCPQFVCVEEADIHSRSNPDGIRFRLVSYNILAQVYVKSTRYPHSPSPCLKWKSRSQAILTVLRNLESDFLCLQEVDEYDTFYKRSVEALGYSSIYIQRTGQKSDGCAIFYKQNRTELLLEEQIEYNDLVDLIQEERISSRSYHSDMASGTQYFEAKKDLLSNDGGDPIDPRVKLKRDCVGMMAAFRIKEPYHHIIIVANTHVYWDPAWIDVKLAQANYLLTRLAKFKDLISDKYQCSPCVIVAGDFNSTPGDEVYRYLVSGEQSQAFLTEISEKAPLPLCSVYAAVRGKEPLFTNCTPDFTNTLDYVLFSPSDRLKPVSLLQLPEEESLDILGFLPNHYHPSDHLPIGAEFEIVLD